MKRSTGSFSAEHGTVILAVAVLGGLAFVALGSALAHDIAGESSGEAPARRPALSVQASLGGASGALARVTSDAPSAPHLIELTRGFEDRGFAVHRTSDPGRATEISFELDPFDRSITIPADPDETQFAPLAARALGWLDGTTRRDFPNDVDTLFERNTRLTFDPKAPHSDDAARWLEPYWGRASYDPYWGLRLGDEWLDDPHAPITRVFKEAARRQAEIDSAPISSESERAARMRELRSSLRGELDRLHFYQTRFVRSDPQRLLIDFRRRVIEIGLQPNHSPELMMAALRKFLDSLDRSVIERALEKNLVIEILPGAEQRFRTRDFQFVRGVPEAVVAGDALHLDWRWLDKDAKDHPMFDINAALHRVMEAGDAGAHGN